MSDFELKTGQIVEIIFGKNKTLGCVIEKNKSKGFASKKIKREISSGSAFAPAQIKLAKLMQDEYLSSFGETLFSFLPTMNLSDLKRLDGDAEAQKSHRGKSELYLSDFDDRQNYFLQTALSCKGQVLIVLPEILQIEKFYTFIKKVAPQRKILRFQSQIPSREKATVWNNALSNESAIIIASRQGLLLPFCNLESICISEPLNFAYQEDQAPYYQAFFVARGLRRITGATLIIGESVPSTTAYVALRQGKLTLKQKHSKLKINTALNFNKFNEHISLQRKIKNVVKSNGRICFVGPWQNQIRFLCASCQREIACFTCQSRYFHQESGLCVKCARQAPICSACQSSRIRKLGFSYRLIRESIEQTMPELSSTIGEGINDTENKKMMILNPADAAKAQITFDLLIFPFFELMSDFATLGYRHKIFRLIYDLPKTKDAEIFLLGENLEENDFAGWVKNFQFREFLNAEIKDRLKLSMPPFGKAVDLVIKDKDEKSATAKMINISKKIGFEITIIRKTIKKDESLVLRGVFFVPRAKWEVTKNLLQETRSGNIHFEIDRGDYL